MLKKNNITELNNKIDMLENNNITEINNKIDMLENNKITEINNKINILKNNNIIELNNKIDMIEKKSQSFDFFPPGVILPFTGDVLPEGFLICDGSSVSRELYPNLFKVIGTRYGSENEDFFNLPNLIDRFIQGASEENKVGSYLSPSLPNIKGTISSYMHYSSNSKLFQISRGIGDNYANHLSGFPDDTSFTFDASQYNEIYKDNCNTVQPNSLCLNYIIKY